MRLLRPIKDFNEYGHILDRLEVLEQSGNEDTREFRDLKRFIIKFETPYIKEAEKEIKKEPQP